MFYEFIAVPDKLQLHNFFFQIKYLKITFFLLQMIRNQYLSKYITSQWLNEWCIYIALYCVLLYTPSAFTFMWGGLSSTTTSVQHPLGWCDGCHRTMVPVRSPHTSCRWRGERAIESIKCMRSPHTSYRWRGERVIESIKCMCSPHTSYRWRGERHRANQVYALTTHQLQVERRET